MIRLCAALLLLAGPAAAHGGHDHATPAAAVAPGGHDGPLPVALGGPFRLTDQHGAARTEAAPAGGLQILFFGYATCEGICALALPTMAETVDLLAARGVAATPVLVTVDPGRDTPEAMVAPLAALHPRFVGLTGTEAELAPVWAAWDVRPGLEFEDPVAGAVYSHGGFLFLLSAEGTLLTLLPPTLPPERLTEIVASYDS